MFWNFFSTTEVDTSGQHATSNFNDALTESDEDYFSNLKISDPTSFVHKVHVTPNLEWMVEDPAEHFVLTDKLGEGSFGKVYRGHHKESTMEMAIKILTVQEDERKNIQKEMDILKGCNHPNIVKYYGCITLGLNQIWLIMDYCEVGSADDLMSLLQQTLTERQCAYVLNGTLKGLQYLHSKHILHRDIKAANILLNARGEVKIADFGVSANMTSGKRRTICGSPYWMAPEVIKEDACYDYSADIWSLGITAIEIAEGEPPLFGRNIYFVMIQIPIMKPPTLAQQELWSEQFKSFLSLCLNKNPEERPSTTKLLEHPFMKNTDQYKPDMDQIIQLYFDMRHQKEMEANIASDPSASPNAGRKRVGTKQVVHDEETGSLITKTKTSALVDEPTGTTEIHGSVVVGTTVLKDNNVASSNNSNGTAIVKNVTMIVHDTIGGTTVIKEDSSKINNDQEGTTIIKNTTTTAITTQTDANGTTVIKDNDVSVGTTVIKSENGTPIVKESSPPIVVPKQDKPAVVAPTSPATNGQPPKTAPRMRNLPKAIPYQPLKHKNRTITQLTITKQPITNTTPNKSSQPNVLPITNYMDQFVLIAIFILSLITWFITAYYLKDARNRLERIMSLDIDCYKALQVNPFATQFQIHDKYDNLLLDRSIFQCTSKECKNKQTEIQTSYSILSDPTNRFLYDMYYPIQQRKLKEERSTESPTFSIFQRLRQNFMGFWGFKPRS